MNNWDNWDKCLKPEFTIVKQGVTNDEHKNNENNERFVYTITGPDPDDSTAIINVGVISVLFDYLERDLYIFALDTDDRFRGNGVGTFLLRYVAVEANNLTPNLLTIHLDDMSEEAINVAKNIYRKLGMVPETDMFQPERKGLVVDIQSSSGWRRFCHHYLKGNNKVFINNPDCPCK